jgi:hypothetical protein
MLYSLPTGKVIELTVEQYLELTDEELEYLISINYGDALENPFFGSALENPSSIIDLPASLNKTFDVPLEDIDNSIDFTPEEE